MIEPITFVNVTYLNFKHVEELWIFPWVLYIVSSILVAHYNTDKTNRPISCKHHIHCIVSDLQSTYLFQEAWMPCICDRFLYNSYYIRDHYGSDYYWKSYWFWIIFPSIMSSNPNRFGYRNCYAVQIHPTGNDAGNIVRLLDFALLTNFVLGIVVSEEWKYAIPEMWKDDLSNWDIWNPACL